MKLFSRLKAGLSKTSDRISEGISSIITKKKLDEQTLEALEELLIMADVGAEPSARIIDTLRTQRLHKEVSEEEIKQFLADEIAKMLAPYAKPLLPEEMATPHVIMVAGVNGNGKTTTIGKLALHYKAQGKKVLLVAADTFRAAAVEQLEVWSVRAEVPLMKGESEADPASVAYRALEQAKAEGCDIVFIDTAGRLHNKQNLMQELQKMIRVMQKVIPEAPHQVIQVLDATTGQNAIQQAKTFKDMIGVNGLILTKLDGTAKGGVVIQLTNSMQLPVHAIGVGEAIEDLQPFDAMEYARQLVSIQSIV